MKKNQNKSFKKGRKRARFFKALKLRQGSRTFSTFPLFLSYFLFRRQFFIFKLTKFGFLKRRIFASEIPEILFGFGDREFPLKKTISEIENFIIKYIVDVISSVSYVSFWRVGKRPTIDDFLFLIRNNPRKLRRITYLLQMKFLIEKVTGSDKTGGPLPKKKFLL